MYESFCLVAKRINAEFSIKPLLYGSFGLQRLLQTDLLHPDDIDILLPESCFKEDWPRLLRLMQEEGYTLTDALNHTFRRGYVEISFELNDLDGYAGIDLSEALSIQEQGAEYIALRLKQYLALYEAFAKEPHRHAKRHSDHEKIRMINQALRTQNHPTG